MLHALCWHSCSSLISLPEILRAATVLRASGQGRLAAHLGDKDGALAAALLVVCQHLLQGVVADDVAARRRRLGLWRSQHARL